MKNLSDYFRSINSSYARDCVENRVRLNSDLCPKVAKFVSHLSGPHIGTQGMQSNLSLGEKVQALRELSAWFTVLADDLAEIDPLRASRCCDRLTLV